MGSSSGGSSGGGSSNSSSSGTYYSPGSNMNGTGKGYTGGATTPSTGTYYSPGSNMNGSGSGYTGAPGPKSTSSSDPSSTLSGSKELRSTGSSNTNSTSDTVTRKEPKYFETLKTTRNLPSWANHATYSNVSAPSYMTNIGGGTASGSMPSVGAYDSSKLASIGNIYGSPGGNTQKIEK
jgi:hypothetical protein